MTNEQSHAIGSSQPAESGQPTEQPHAVEPSHPMESAQPVEQPPPIESPDATTNLLEAELGGDMDAFASNAARFAPRYLAIATAAMLWWAYLVLGEFVLAGVPEWFGWFVVMAAGVASYLALERRLSAYLPENSAKERITNGIVTSLVCVAGLLLAMIFGVLLPEPLVTPLMLLVVVLVAWWKGRKREREFGTLPPESGWLLTARIAFIGVLTLGAAVLFVSRLG